MTFRRGAAVHGIILPRLETSAGPVEVEAVVVCPGDDFLSLYPGRLASFGLTKCLLQMLRVRPEASFRLGHPVMSDLTLARYDGYAALPEADALKARIRAERPAYPDAGIHLIAVASADGSLVVGDSHVYDPTPAPFASAAVDELMLDELRATLALRDVRVVERWTGIYASGGDRLMLMDAPEPRVRVVIVTSGTGASTSFAITEETMTDLYD